MLPGRCCSKRWPKPHLEALAQQLAHDAGAQAARRARHKHCGTWKQQGASQTCVSMPFPLRPLCSRHQQGASCSPGPAALPPGCPSCPSPARRTRGGVLAAPAAPRLRAAALRAVARLEDRAHQAAGALARLRRLLLAQLDGAALLGAKACGRRAGAAAARRGEPICCTAIKATAQPAWLSCASSVSGGSAWHLQLAPGAGGNCGSGQRSAHRRSRPSSRRGP